MANTQRTQPRSRKSSDKIRPIKRVLVAGAGVAGLQCAREFLRAGCKVLTLEEHDDVGGVWLKNYQGYKLQVPLEFYQFPEFPYQTKSLQEERYRSGHFVQAYARAYASHFGLLKHIRFGCKLLKLHRRGKGGWKVFFQDKEKNCVFQVNVDFAVICTGIYSQPYVPDCQDIEKFEGRVIHSKNFDSTLDVHGKRVVIVGSGKTAWDCVAAVSSANQADTVQLLCRQAHWPLPRNLTARTGKGRLLYSRCMSVLLPSYYADSPLRRGISALLSPVRRLFWSCVENSAVKQYPHLKQTRPAVRLPEDLLYSGKIMEDEFEKCLQQANVQVLQGAIHRFEANGVLLGDNKFLWADIVVFCTGYTRSYKFFDSATSQYLEADRSGAALYRQMISPSIPNLAFVGAEVSTHNNILTSALQAAWLVHMLVKQPGLPSTEEMLKDIKSQQRWRDKLMPAQRMKSSVVGAYMQRYHDQLVGDMGLKLHRKGINPFKECFSPYSATDYEEVFTGGAPVLAYDPLLPGNSMSGMGQVQDNHPARSSSRGASFCPSRADTSLSMTITGVASSRSSLEFSIPTGPLTDRATPSAKQKVLASLTGIQSAPSSLDTTSSERASNGSSLRITLCNPAAARPSMTSIPDEFPVCEDPSLVSFCTHVASKDSPMTVTPGSSRLDCCENPVVADNNEIVITISGPICQPTYQRCTL